MKGRGKDITGETFNRLTAISFHHYGSGYNYWEFKCSCGEKCIAQASVVWRGIKKSCGCLGRETQPIANLKHGCRNKRIYKIWHGMKQRCLNPKHDAFSRYAGRNIKICKRWMKFENFLADMGEPEAINITLDRRDNSKGYNPKNCRWADKKTQNRNARTNLKIEYNGEIKCLSEWAEIYKINYHTLWDRYHKNGWSIERALIEPLHTEKARY